MLIRISVALLALLALAAGAATAAPAASGKGAKPPSKKASGDIFPFKVEQRSLDNGFRVVVIPYDSPGTVAYYTLVRTGSRDEIEPGHSGFAHFFEHMMFRGTDKYPQDRYTQVLKGMGADSNAFTTDDFTLYHIVGPARELETMMDMESDRFKNLKYGEEGFRTEALAVLGEYNKDASSPFLPLEEKLRDLAFTKHTYKHTTIGFIADVKAMPGYYDFSRQFFARFYRPENCVLLVVGDAAPQNVFALAARYYGDWQKGYQPSPITPEPPQTEQKKAHLDWPSPGHPFLFEGYHIPAFSTAGVDAAALQVIGQLLLAESSPLYQELVVDKQWVDFVQGGADLHRDPYLFTVIARTKSEELIPKVQEAVDHAIAELQGKPVDPERLARITSHLRYGFALGLNTPGQVAGQVAQFLAWSGGIDSINQSFAAIDKVTPADIQRLAREIFQPQNQTIVTLSHPAGKDGKQEKPAGAAGSQGGGESHD
ncbi:MAG TPA: pitrilysin family protein [Thermoanaerobaculia bacterium]|nr:pitrilysin family protein [Thermoanaerobaculia bacterium]